MLISTCYTHTQQTRFCFVRLRKRGRVPSQNSKIFDLAVHTIKNEYYIMRMCVRAQNSHATATINTLAQ